MQLPFLCEKSGAIALVLLGLTASKLAVRQAGRQNSAKFRFLKTIYQMKYSLFAIFNKGMVFLWLYKCILVDFFM